MKKTICLILVLVMSLSLGINIMAADTSIPNVEGKYLFEDTASVTQEDLNTNFQNYATGSSHIDFPITYSNESTANVVGVVLDEDTNMPVAGACVKVGDGIEVLTDNNGRFQIKNFPDGQYTWIVSAEEYSDGRYLNYHVDGSDGANIFTFYISSGRAIVQDRNDVIRNNQEIEHDHGIESLSDGEDIETFSMSKKPTLSVGVNVYRTATGTTTYVGRQAYIYTVLSTELYDTSWYIEKGLTKNQVVNLYRAQAIVSNTYLEYCQNVYSNHDMDSYPVCDTQCCQVFDPTRVTQTAIDAAVAISDHVGGKNYSTILLYKPTSTTYDYSSGMFFSSCNNKGTIDNEYDPSLKGKTCSNDLLPWENGGHRMGFCQMGAATRAKNGASYLSLLSYYFTNCETASCEIP